MEMVAIFDFRALTKVYNFKTTSSNAVKIENIHEEAYRSVF